jgi:hypothetical protein
VDRRVTILPSLTGEPYSARASFTPTDDWELPPLGVRVVTAEKYSMQACHPVHAKNFKREAHAADFSRDEADFEIRRSVSAS